jgi:hypothetical protein
VQSLGSLPIGPIMRTYPPLSGLGRPGLNKSWADQRTGLALPYQEKMYAIVITRPGGDKRLFGRIRRSPKGDVYAVWAEDESPHNLGKGSNPHASYHANGRLHSKTHNRPAVVRSLQVPAKDFRGNQPIEGTNADRGLSPTLPAFVGQFDDIFEIPLDLISGNSSQSFAVDLVEPGVSPVELTRRDKVLAQKVFRDDVPWIVVRLVEPSDVAV